jgi:hypothetical protein
VVDKLKDEKEVVVVQIGNTPHPAVSDIPTSDAHKYIDIGVIGNRLIPSATSHPQLPAPPYRMRK